MERPNLVSAYRAARADTFYQNGRAIRPAPAAPALKLARENLARFHDAAADREDKAAAREAARIAANESKAAAAFLAREGGPRYEAAGAAVTAAVGALDAADRALDVATRRLRAAEGLAGRYASPYGAGDYGAGTWQGGNPDTSPAALPFYLPPAMRASERAGRLATSARAMHNRPDSDSPRRDPGGRFYWHNVGGRDVLRNVRDAGDVWRGASEWFDNPLGESFRDGTGLVVGVVGQLRGRDGRAVFVAGWRFKGHDDNGTFDLRQRFTAEGREESDAEEAAEAAAREADSLAEAAAEAEREYQAAWGAGQAWAEAGEELAAARASVRELLAERRAARKAGKAELPAICRAIRDSVSGFLADIAAARQRREELAEGEDSTWPHDGGRAARAAFCEGAGLELARAPF